LYCPKTEISFTAKIDELQNVHSRLACELDKWKHQATLELEMRQQAEEEVNQLKITLQEAQRDNKKLEEHIQKWKLIAEQYNGSIVKYYQGIGKMFTILEELKSELPFER
jgi:chromosome segregation ATPase